MTPVSSPDETPAAGSETFAEAVARVLADTEPGDVLTYGDVADSAGFPGAARAVGSVLRATDGLPWWRVVTSTGRLVPGLEERHGKLLRREGVALKDGRVRPG